VKVYHATKTLNISAVTVATTNIEMQSVVASFKLIHRCTKQH